MPEVQPPLRNSFIDTFVIYFSEEDGKWIGHSLRTDQLGTGDRIVDALADVIRAVDAVCDMAEEDATLAYLREAPPEIQSLAQNAKRLPGEIYEVAHLMATGRWPQEWTPPDIADRTPFATDPLELDCFQSDDDLDADLAKKSLAEGGSIELGEFERELGL